MRQSAKAGGTKIAQAAKDLNVTSVTIRRYIQEFSIDTAADENGIKVLPQQAMDELQEIRRLKEDGMTNPQVMEFLEERRAKGPSKSEAKAEKEPAAKKTTARRAEPKAEKPVKKEPVKRSRARVEEEDAEDEAEEEEDVAPAAAVDDDASGGDGDRENESEGGEEGGDVELSGDGKSKHSLTCQTCSKVFEHMNPRLRDCLDCYRSKRKERRRGGDKHKNVIAHPIAQQVMNKQQQPMDAVPAEPIAGDVSTALTVAAPVQRRPASSQPRGVRNYRKAIEDTRHITANLKRRLERPDLPESERRWLEQIYAYQLILHQGWRHLAEYKAGTHPQKPQE